jgi:hypothetical protein
MLTYEQLYETQIALGLACGRAKSVLRDKHRTRFCFLGQVLLVEFNNRGLPPPPPPYRA